MQNDMRILSLYLIYALVVGLAGSVLAEDMSSGNFMVRDAAINEFGGTSSSTSFTSEMSESQIETTQSSSTNFILQMGPLALGDAAFLSQNWRWYADEENETPLSALAAENTAPIDIEDQDIIKLRVAVAETAGYGMEGVKFHLQFSTSSDFSSGAQMVAPQYGCDGGVWCYADGADSDGALITTRLLTDADTCSGGVGAGCGTHNESATSTSSALHSANAIAEYEFTIQQSGAAINTVFFFRLVETVSSTTIALNTGETYPSLVTGGASLNFTINGLASGTSTEGITTDVATSPTAIHFGTLSENLPAEGAQRITVTTNGTGGYRVYLYERQELLSELGARIDPVSGTNETPTDWTSGCLGALGCFGYHSGDDTLDGAGVTRFAANDSYAEATSTPYTIAYHSGSTSNQETDVVYKIETRNGQDNGDYSTSLVYIVAPIF